MLLGKQFFHSWIFALLIFVACENQPPLPLEVIRTTTAGQSGFVLASSGRAFILDDRNERC
jgi:hypothetical protein